MIVRWGIEELPDVLDELGVTRPLLVTSARWRDIELPVVIAPSVPSEPMNRSIGSISGSAW